MLKSERRGPAAVGRLIDEYALRDARLGMVDWRTLPPGVEAWVFNAPSGPLAATRTVDSTDSPVIMLPGLTGSKEDFNLMMPLLEKHGYSGISLDLAGQYQSAWLSGSREREYNWELFAKDIEALLRQTGPAHLVGLSFAGQIVQRVAVSRPEDVLSVTLLSAPPAVGDVFTKVKIGGPLAPLFPAEVKAWLMLTALRYNVIRARKDRGDFVKHRVPYHSRRALRDVFKLMEASPDLSQQFANLPLPKLVTAGTHDLWSIERHRAYADEIGATAAFYQTGHSPCETVPSQLIRDMLPILRLGDSRARNARERLRKAA